MNDEHTGHSTDKPWAKWAFWLLIVIVAGIIYQLGYKNGEVAGIELGRKVEISEQERKDREAKEETQKIQEIYRTIDKARKSLYESRGY